MSGLNLDGLHRMVSFRLTFDEYDALQERLKESGENQSEYIRKSLKIRDEQDTFLGRRRMKLKQQADDDYDELMRNLP